MSSATIETDRAPADPASPHREIFEIQRAHRSRVAASTPSERREKLRKLKRRLLETMDELKAALSSDLNRSPVETEIIEVQPTLVELNYAIRHLGEWMRPRMVDTPILLLGARSEIRYEPRGNVLLIAPWNYPVYLTISALVAAIAAGNCVILKPPERVPATSAWFARLLPTVFPREEIAVVEGGVSTASALLDLPFDHIFFTGSTRTGRTIMTAAAKHLASVTLELGGKSPVIVDATANLDRTAERIVWGRFINAGQTCVAPDYVLADATIAEALGARIVAVIERFYSGGATSSALCSIVDEGSVRRFETMLADATTRGARALTGGSVDVSGRRVAPTVLVDVPRDAMVMREEIFGPILPIATWSSLDELVSRIGSGEKPLALYVFSRNRTFVEQVLSRTSSGGAAVNDVVMQLTNPSLPFGGVGASGMGHYHGAFGFRAFSHERAVLRQGPVSPLRLFFPPYTPRVAKLSRLVTRFLGLRR